MRRGSTIAVAVLGALAVLPSGCAVAVDFVNPDFLTRLGIDVDALQSPSGTVIMMFTNNSSGQATFQAFEIPDLNHRDRGSRNFSVQVPPGESGNEVLECPVAALGLGSLGADFNVSSTVGATVDSGSGSSTVSFEGAPLYSPSDFQCGDLILVELSADGATLTVQVLPS